MHSMALLVTYAIGAAMSPSPSSEGRCCPVIELRQYTLKPGQRETLIDLFDRHFIESQEALGMTIVGQFRDRRRADRFVWLRGFSDMSSRHRALEQFYGGPVWAAHRNAANDTMLDSDDVLLLRPARPEMAFRVHPRDQSAKREAGASPTVAGLYEMPRPADDALVSQFERQIVPILRANGVNLEGVFVTEPARNTFTRLPVREGLHMLVWFGTLEQREAPAAGWLERLTSAASLADQPVTVLELDPTSRSRLGGQQSMPAASHDFDFLQGAWKVHNRYLKGRLRGSTEWIEFEGQSKLLALLKGLGHLEQYSAMRDGQSIEGVTLRLFNPATGEWSLYWADTVRAGVLQPPMIGRFRDGVGEFFGDEEVDGRKVQCRFRWSLNSSGSPQWEQAFSDDGGKTWETNWIMTFTREGRR
jgi:NIPSNAP